MKYQPYQWLFPLLCVSSRLWMPDYVFSIIFHHWPVMCILAQCSSNISSPLFFIFTFLFSLNICHATSPDVFMSDLPTSYRNILTFLFLQSCSKKQPFSWSLLCGQDGVELPTFVIICCCPSYFLEMRNCMLLSLYLLFTVKTWIRVTQCGGLSFCCVISYSSQQQEKCCTLVFYSLTKIMEMISI